MRVILLDRDGVINRYPGDMDYVKSWGEFHFLPKVRPSLKKLSNCGYRLFIISNQAGVSKGLYSKDKLKLITKNMLKGLGKEIKISGVYYCTHKQQDNCSCRKPKAGLIDLVVSRLKRRGEEIQLSKSYFIGDSIRDVEAGKRRGLKTILVFSGKEKPQNRGAWKTQPDFTAFDLAEAAKIILLGRQ